MKFEELVSICISSYNHANYIEECIQSALSQTYSNIEVIVVDDASTDDSSLRIQRLAERHSDKIRFYQNEKNQGVSLTANRAIDSAKGKYIALLGSDDRMRPERIRRQVDFLEIHQDTVAVFSKIRAINAEGESEAGFASTEELFNQPIKDIRSQLFSGNFMNAPSAMIRTDAIRAIGGFSPALLYTQDYDAWLKLLSLGKLSRISDVLTDYRIHGGNLSFSNNNDLKLLKMRLEVVAAVVRAADLWPIESWLSDEQQRDDPKVLANIRLAIAAHLARLDFANFNKPLLAASKAYSLAIQGAEGNPEQGMRLKTSLESWLLGEQPPVWLKSLSGCPIDITKFDPAELNFDAPGAGRWTLTDWFNDRSPSLARISALQAMIKAHEDVGTFGAVIVLTSEMNGHGLKQTLDSLKKQHCPFKDIWVVGGTLPDEFIDETVYELPGGTSWQRQLSDRIEQGETPDFLWILYAGDQLLPHATLTLGEYRLRMPDPLVWYVDEAIQNDGKPANPMLKPDFNIDLLRSYPYVGRNLVLSTAAIQAVGGLDEQMADLAPIDLIWRMVEQAGPPVVGHVPEVLLYGARGLMDWVQDAATLACSPAVTQAHFVRLGLDAQVQSGPVLGLFRIEYPLPVQPLVSIIVPTRDHFTILRDCVEGLMGHTAYLNYELLVVDNGSIDSEAVAFLAKLEELAMGRVRILRWAQAFDFAAMNNFAVEQARGEILLFLNNDIQFSSETRRDWLERLLRLALRPEVGMAGTRLDLLSGRVDQYGQVLGLDNSVGLAFRGEPSNRQGYMYRLIVQQNTSALSASCLMMRRTVFQELGGFNAKSFPIYYADTDLSLKATQAGYLLALEPETGLLHMGGATRLLTERFGLAARPDDEQRDRLYSRWLPQLARDPYYHPAFGKSSPGFNLSQDGSRIYDPLPGRPLPVVMASHADWHGCGHYRILHPFKAMADEFRLEGGIKYHDFHFTDVARVQPDVIVLQGAWLNEGILTQIRRYREITGAKVALEFDDYLPNIPTRSAYRGKLHQGSIKHMRRAIEQVDWLVVSTNTLAQEYAEFHDDIRVAHNGLLPQWWGALDGRRRVGKKMRVGWAGGISHAGDLAEIRAVVGDLQGEVEWVFMGMKPDNVACEFHAGVEIERYPEKLAGLNLDLAVVPLELNQFNRCKSNLRLLELGACGVPVICTNIEPYRGELPVTRVRNRPQDWVRAIRDHLSDPDALASRGDALRETVRRSWMLEGNFLDQWAAAWGIKSDNALGAE